MDKNLTRVAPAFFALILAAPLASKAGAKTEVGAGNGDALGSISISAFTFQNSNGVAVVTLYNDENTWQEIPKAYRKKILKIKGKSIYLKFENLPTGVYGVYVLHDENKNNKMDMKWFPYPRPGEGVGGSNNYTKGRPKWKHVKFKVEPGENKALKIKLKYF